MKKEKGFTLVEMIVVIALTAVVGAIILAISVTSGKLFSMTQTDSAFNDEARILLGSLEDDLIKSIKVDESNFDASGEIPAVSSVVVKTIEGLDLTLDVQPVAEVGVAITRKEEGQEVYYLYTRTKVANELRVIKYYQDAAGTWITNEVITLSNVTLFNVVKESGGSKKYKIDIKFNDENDHEAVFESLVSPRN